MAPLWRRKRVRMRKTGKHRTNSLQAETRNGAVVAAEASADAADSSGRDATLGKRTRCSDSAAPCLGGQKKKQLLNLKQYRKGPAPSTPPPPPPPAPPRVSPPQKEEAGYIYVCNMYIERDICPLSINYVHQNEQTPERRLY
jgi:hypothetical protein